MSVEEIVEGTEGWVALLEGDAGVLVAHATPVKPVFQRDSLTGQGGLNVVLGGVSEGAYYQLRPIIGRGEGGELEIQRPWRRVRGGRCCNRQFKATVRPDGRPANRTLVFRGFVEGTDKFQFTTDARSAKIDDIKHCPFGEICYYFTDSWEQFRILGQLDLIGHADADPARKSLRERAWFASSLKSRVAFSLPYPGLAKSDTPLIDPDQGPLDPFYVLTLEPEQVDYYNSRDNASVVFKSSETSSGQRDWSREEVE